ncbi:peptide-methionine (R)-S-oxide reductase MsrB [Pseudooceanicola sp.]|uniref:peptide-methionine (R)-S-oxide reductase MsrB n=1 Tax=Pseudooceanicola sp. TaxID=1914328 RepID=UPI00262FFBED|nr:peptide-methionine (R)-S-oxide reductase MsrB [Pseudooceanicola sp.]MDF1854358.1 peptide-methionine (R)-S-oxide reductase MsrB [Pseudooceanicola sp.]
MNRRTAMFSAAAASLVGAAPLRAANNFEITRSDAEWRRMLTPQQYKVMRQEGTEPAGSSPLNKLTAEGRYLCRGCDLPLYSSATKYDSGTGWPSFWQALPGAIATKSDRNLFQLRIECHCRRCGSHLGHIFDDGPKPTGKRHCLNGVSLKFAAA